MLSESDRSQNIEEKLSQLTSDYDLKIQELLQKISEYEESKEKSNKLSDEKDLEISRLRRENEDLTKKKKNQSEKVLEY